MALTPYELALLNRLEEAYRLGRPIDPGELKIGISLIEPFARLVSDELARPPPSLRLGNSRPVSPTLDPDTARTITQLLLGVLECLAAARTAVSTAKFHEALLACHSSTRPRP